MTRRLACYLINLKILRFELLKTRRPLLIAALFLFLFTLTLIVVLSIGKLVMKPTPQLLTDPFLQLPTQNSVRVVWFTEFAGARHTVTYGEGLQQTATASTTKLSRTREDQKSKVGKQTETNQIYQKPTMRDIWRHEAVVTGLTPGKRVPYQVTSITEEGQKTQQ